MRSGTQGTQSRRTVFVEVHAVTRRMDDERALLTKSGYDAVHDRRELLHSLRGGPTMMQASQVPHIDDDDRAIGRFPSDTRNSHPCAQAIELRPQAGEYATLVMSFS